MPRRRFGLPILWCTVGAAIWGVSEVASGGWPAADGDGVNIYSMGAHTGYELSLSVWSAAFGVAYAFLDIVLRATYWRPLAWLHLLSAAGGDLLILGPGAYFRFGGMPDYDGNLPGVFAAAQRIQSMGYLLTLVGLALFLVLLVDAARRRTWSWPWA